MNTPSPKTFSPAVRRVLPCLLLLCGAWSLIADAQERKTEAAVLAAADYLQKNNYKRALETIEPVLATTPADPMALNVKGAILTKQKDYAGAQACFESALQASPGMFAARYNLGDLLVKRQQLDAATAYFQNLLAEQPGNELLQYKLLLLLLRRNADPGLQARLLNTEVPTGTAAWYYARAARAFQKGERGEAAKYVAVAQSVFGDQTAIFQEELDESGLKNHR